MQNILATKGRTLVGIVSKVVDDTTVSQRTQYSHIGKIQVRIPEFHGPKSKDDLPSSAQGSSGVWTSDESLPWVPVCFPLGKTSNDLKDLFKVDEMVYVTYSDDEYQSPVVIGTTGRFVDQGIDSEGGVTSTSDNGQSPLSGFEHGTRLDIKPGVFNKPISSRYVVTSNYGKRIIGGKESFHNGIDLGASLGTAVYPALDGIVITAIGKYTDNSGSLSKKGYGNEIVIQHVYQGQTFYTRYGHLYKVGVSVNQTVSAGEKIAEVGSTGNSTGPHLHFEILNGGTTGSKCSLNPANYITF